VRARTATSALTALAASAACAMTDVPAAVEPAFPALEFRRPVDLQHAGDGSGMLYVVEQHGVIHRFENRRDVARSEVFLDIRSRVSRSGNEEGLLGLAFHPAYADNGRFFVYYSAADPRRSVLAEYARPRGGGRVDPAAERVLMEVEQPWSNHNGGQIVFGPHGHLYVALGDGGAGGDPQDHGENPRTLLGSILRIDVARPEGGRAYAIPRDNPFVDNAKGWREEIWAYGLRNPWRFSFDPATGRLWAGDVGQNAYEEVTLIEKGRHHGWNLVEGSHCFEPPTGCDKGGLVMPVWEYDHSQGQFITGGYVYRGERLPALRGRYVYADFVSGRIWSLNAEDPASPDNRLIADSGLGIASFGVDDTGELYLLAFDGRIYRLAR